MNIWLQNSMDNLLPKSVSNVFSEALSEWHFNGNVREEKGGSCGLCEYHPLLYLFTIINEHNGNHLETGSVCITKFDIRAKENGAILSAEETEQKLVSAKHRLLEEARIKSVEKVLDQLVNNAGLPTSFVEYHKDHGAFTPKQMELILWKCKIYDVDIIPKDFKIKKRRDREKNQMIDVLVNLEKKNKRLARQFLQVLSKSQKKWVIKRL